MKLTSTCNGSSPTSLEAGRTLIIGSTGFIGRFIAEASLDAGRPTYVLVRSSTCKASVIDSLRLRGAIIIHGSAGDRDFMEKILRELKIEVVISAIGAESILEQLHVVEAIKAVGTVKRFLPSEFGHDIDRADPVEPALSMYNEKRKVRRRIEEAAVPYTYICCNSIAGWPYHDNIHPADALPPLDYFKIYGDGTVKAYFVAGTDIAKFTIRAIDDDRTLNKSLHFQPEKNLLNVNELASLWEKKIGRTIPRKTVTGDDLLSIAREMRIPESIVAALTHDIFIDGCQLFSMDKPTDVEVSALYPETPFRSVDECFEEYAAMVMEEERVVVDVLGPSPAIEPPLSSLLSCRLMTTVANMSA